MRFIIILSLYYLYTAYRVSQLWPSSRAAVLVTSFLLFALLIGWQFLYRFHPQIANMTGFRVLSWVSSVALGIWATTMIIALPVDLYHLLYSIWNRVALEAIATDATPLADRRGFLTTAMHSVGLQWALLGASGGMATLGLAQVLRGPRRVKVSVPLPKLPADLHGLKIVQVSDLHIGPTIQTGYVESVVQQIKSAEPDLIVVTGDLADGNVEIIGHYLEPFRQLTPRYGIYYVTGNHEYYWGAKQWVEHTKTLGWIPLINSNRRITIGSTSVLIAGVTDPAAAELFPEHLADLTTAAHDPETSAFRILLAHRPDACFEAEHHNFHLQLSGHTHAGQFFPFSLFIPLVHKYYRGLNRHGRMWVYVNPGTGYWGPANRFGITPEVSVLELVTTG